MPTGLQRLVSVAANHPPLPNSNSRAASPRPSNGAARVNLFDEQFLNSFFMPSGPRLDLDITMDPFVKQINNEQHFSPTSSIVPYSLTPPSFGAGSNLTTYISNPTSCQPSKKAYQGVNAASTVTAAFSTSSAAPPTQISIYTNKRNALASPAKGGATRTKDVVDLSAMDGVKNSKVVIDLSGKAGGSA